MKVLGTDIAPMPLTAIRGVLGGGRWRRDNWRTARASCRAAGNVTFGSCRSIPPDIVRNTRMPLPWPTTRGLELAAAGRGVDLPEQVTVPAHCGLFIEQPAVDRPARRRRPGRLRQYAAARASCARALLGHLAQQHLLQAAFRPL